MASLTDNKIKDTYVSLLKVSDNGELDANLQEITDGAGNNTGVQLNTGGDLAASGTVSFGSLKDSGENITVTKFVDEADGISNNDNDTSIPTSAAVKDYVDSNVTAQDLDITDGTNNGSVDLDSQSLTFTGDAGVSATVSGQTLTLDSSALQSQITSNDSDITALQAADTTLQNNIDAEEAARIAADTDLANDISTEASTRASADTTLQGNIDAEASTRAAADTSLQNQITANDGDISGLDTRLTTAEGNITSNDGDISALDGRLTTAEAGIFVNDQDITNLNTRLTTAEGNITSNDSDISALQSGKQDISEKNQANGYAPLDGGAKVPIANLPDSVVGQVEYQGTWNASTDTPTLPSASTVKGHYYVVSAGGTYETITYAIGDWVISNGTAWEKVDNTDAVTTVFGRLGAIVANESDYSAYYPLISDLNTTNSNVSGLDTRLTTAEGDITAIETKTDFITVTQTVNLDTIESDTAANTSKLAGIEAGAQVNTVDSVNTQTGAVVLDADDIDDTTTANKFTSQAEIDKLAGIEALADVTDATNVAAAGALMDGTAVLSDLNDVASTSPSDGQVLTYDTVNGWQPETPSGGGTIDGSGTANRITKWSDADTITNSVIYDNGTNVGIGTSSPNKKLEILSTNSDHLRLAFNGSAYWDLFQNAPDGSFRILKDNGSLFTFTQAGSLGIGTSSPVAKLESYIVNTGAIGASSNANIALSSNGAVDTRSIMTFGKQISGGYAPAFLGFITTDGTGSSKGDIIFGARSVTTDSAPTERMRITSAGNVGIGTSSPSVPLEVNVSGAGDVIKFTRDTGTNGTLTLDFTGANSNFNSENGGYTFSYSGSEKMRITSGGEVYIAGTTDRGTYNLQCNGTGVWGQGAYVNGSDIRFKEEVKPIESGLDVVEKLKPVSYKYKEEFSRDLSTQAGFIAQDLQEALEGKEYLDGIVKSDSEYLSVAYQSLIPILTKAIQELKAEIETLKSQING